MITSTASHMGLWHPGLLAMWIHDIQDWFPSRHMVSRMACGTWSSMIMWVHDIQDCFPWRADCFLYVPVLTSQARVTWYGWWELRTRLGWRDHIRTEAMTSLFQVIRLFIFLPETEYNGGFQDQYKYQYSDICKLYRVLYILYSYT